jgi:uncharacterized protein YigE (DUF2233 family)
MLRRYLYACLFLFISNLLFAGTLQWQAKIAYQKNLPQQGYYRLIEAHNNTFGKTVYIHAVYMPQQRYHAFLVGQPNILRYFSGLDVHANTKKHHAILGINGGYFTPSYAPLGLLIINHHVIAPLRRSKLLSGLILINNQGRLSIKWRSTYYKNAKFAFQSGPFLLTPRGRYLSKSKPEASRRTVLAITKQGNLLALSTTPITLANLASILKHHPKTLTSEPLKAAINLDGGTSSAMTLFLPEEKALVIPERLPVRSVLMFAPRVSFAGVPGQVMLFNRVSGV